MLADAGLSRRAEPRAARPGTHATRLETLAQMEHDRSGARRLAFIRGKSNFRRTDFRRGFVSPLAHLGEIIYLSHIMETAICPRPSTSSSSQPTLQTFRPLDSPLLYRVMSHQTRLYSSHGNIRSKMTNRSK